MVHAANINLPTGKQFLCNLNRVHAGSYVHFYHRTTNTNINTHTHTDDMTCRIWANKHFHHLIPFSPIQTFGHPSFNRLSPHQSGCPCHMAPFPKKPPGMISPGSSMPPPSIGGPLCCTVRTLHMNRMTQSRIFNPFTNLIHMLLMKSCLQ
jgi:hypothetical protein